jgi:hypothetical protein
MLATAMPPTVSAGTLHSFSIRTKLLLEVAGRTPERPVVPVAGKEPRVSCLIGEKIWQDRWGR